MSVQRCSYLTSTTIKKAYFVAGCKIFKSLQRWLLTSGKPRPKGENPSSEGYASRYLVQSQVCSVSPVGFRSRLHTSEVRTLKPYKMPGKMQLNLFQEPSYPIKGDLFFILGLVQHRQQYVSPQVTLARKGK
jgi:hypothetical protein